MGNGWRRVRRTLTLVPALATRTRASRGWGTRIVIWMLATGLTAMALAQAVSTTTVQGTVYLANGQPAGGSVTISWPSFATATGQAVAADATTVTIGADGFLSVNLAPNVGSTPSGEYYTVIFHLSDGETSTQYWVVPAAAQATLAAVQAQVMPAAQAVQTVSKAYVDQAIAELSQSALSATGGTLTGPLYLSGDPTQPLQAADKHYVDTQTAAAEASAWPGLVLRADEFAGTDIGARIQACVNALSATYGGTCDARNFTGSLTMASNLTIATGNVAVLLPCATITTASQIVVTAGTRNVALRGCALRGGSQASGSTGGTALAYTGTGAMVEVGDPTYATNTPGFHMDNMVINTTGATSATAEGPAAYRTQEMDVESVYFLGNQNQTGMTLDGTGNYTGGTFLDDEFGGFGTAVNAIGHQAGSTTATDWMNASTFVRLHIDCPTSSGNPISGTIGINLQQGDGNTFTGGDVEGCGTMLHLGPNAQNNTIVGLRNENSTNQVVADAGSAYNNWITGGTMFNGKLTDNGTRNSFLDTFHRSFNALNGDWYGSQTDATLTNHFRLGNGAGNERGLLNEIQTDYGYRWIYGFSDAAGGQQLYQLQDLLNNVYRLQIQQWNNGQSSTNNQTALNAAGTGNVCFNCSANSGTGGVTFASGGASPAAVATVDSQGDGQFVGNLEVGGTTQSAGNLTVRNSADAQIGLTLWPGLTTSQKGVVTFKDWNGNSQWFLVKDTSNNWALNSAVGGLDSFKAYQSTNSGDTYIDASNSTGHIRLNYESGAGAETDIYSGPSASLDAAFVAPNAIKFPGLAATAGDFCLQIDNSGYITNTGSPCGVGSGGTTGTINSGSTGQVAYYTTNGSVLGGTSAVPVTSGGTGATSASGALANLLPGAVSDGKNGVALTGNVAAAESIPATSPYADIRKYGAAIDGATDIGPAVQSAVSECPNDSGTGGNSCVVLLPCGGVGCYWRTQTHIEPPSDKSVVVKVQGKIQMGNTLQVYPEIVIQGDGGGTPTQFQNVGSPGQILGANVAGTLGTAIASTNTAVSFTPTFTSGSIGNFSTTYPTDSWITVVDPVTVTTTGTVTRTAYSSGANVSATLSAYTRIAAGSTITVTGCADSSFDATGTFVVSANFPAHTITWPEPSGAAGTTTGCTIAGWNQDSFETVNISAVGSSTLTASFMKAHLATARWGMVGVAMPPAVGPFEMDSMTISGAPGAEFAAQDLAQMTLIGDGFSAYPAVTSIAADLSSIDSMVRDSSFNGSLANFWTCASAVNCGEPSYSSGAARCTHTGTIGLEGNCADTAFRDNTFYGGFEIDGANEVQARPPYMYHTEFRQSSADGIVIDNRYGSGPLEDEFPILEDNSIGAPDLCFVGATDGLSGDGVGWVDIHPFEPNDTYCLVDPNFPGLVNGFATESMILPIARYGYPTGTFNSPGQILTEFHGEDAGMGPSVVPFATAPALTTTQVAAACTSLGSCTTKGVLAPDGTTNAIEIDAASGGTAQAVAAASPWENIYTGDWILYGAKERNGTGQTAPGGWYGSTGINIANITGETLLGGAPFTYQMQFSANEGWHTVVGLAEVSTGDGASHPVTLNLWPGPTAGSGNQFFDWFLIYVPGPNNPAYTGVTADMVEQWRRELLHGTVPQNFNHPGVAATLEPIATPALEILNPSTGAIAPIGTSNLADWTDSGAANGAVPMWNATTSQWTPETLPSNVSSINGTSGAFTFVGPGINCSGTTCTVAGTTASGNVQAGSQYSPAYYSQSGSGTTVSGVTPFTGLGYWSASAAPAAATAAQIVSAIGSTPVANATSATSATSATTATNFSGSLAGDVTGTQSATTVGKINGGSVPASAAVLGTNASGQPAAATAHSESLPRTCATTNSGNAYSCTTSPTFTAASGDTVSIDFNAANTGSATLAVNGAAAATIKKWGNSSGLAANDVLAGHWISATFDGTYWQLEGQLGNANATQVNGASVPTSSAANCTNASSQIVACSTSGSGNVVLATSPTLSAPTVSGTLAGASETLSGTLSVTGTQTLGGATTMQSNVTLENGANANQTLAIQPGSSADTVGAVQFNNYAGTAKWQVQKDANNYLRVTDAANSLDRVILPPNANTTINAGAGANAVVINNTSGSGTSGFIVYEGGSNSSTAALQVTGSGNTTATGFLQGKFIMGSGTMTMGAGAAAGTSPSIACATNHVCDGVSGTVALTTGTSPTTGTLATLTFPNTHTNQANCIVATQSATAVITTNTWTESTTAITITANTAPTASTAYTIKYWCGSY